VNLSRTPIAASLQAAAADLSAAQGETLIVLVSDGEENCDGDPVAAAAALRQRRSDLRVSVVGFDIAPDLRERLAQIAEAGGGMYVDARAVGALLDELGAGLPLDERAVELLDRCLTVLSSGEALPSPISLPSSMRAA
jgi:hypothetical protein